MKPDALAKWGERKPILKSNALRITTTVLCVLWIAGMVAWGLWGLGAIALAISALNLAWAHRMHARWDEAAEAIEEATHDLDVLAGVLRLIDHGEFSAAKLHDIQSRLRHADFVPSDAIRKLDRIVGYLESRRNPAMRLLGCGDFLECAMRFPRGRMAAGVWSAYTRLARCGGGI